MILAIDVGNTNISAGCIVGGEIVNEFRIMTNISRTADEYAIQIDTMLKFRNIERVEIEGAVISSVVPPLTSIIKDAVKQLAAVEPIVVGAGVKTGLNILIDDPGQLGADIVSTAIGALARYSAPVIIVDLGTATKMFVLNANGSFIGGAILTGVALSMNALATGTSQLPRIPLEAPAKSISTNTIDCIKSGVIFGAASAIDGMIERFEAQLGQKAVVVATGGIAEPVYRHCKSEITYDPHLILRGLGIIYEKNVKK